MLFCGVGLVLFVLLRCVVFVFSFVVLCVVCLCVVLCGIVVLC